MDCINSVSYTHLFYFINGSAAKLSVVKAIAVFHIVGQVLLHLLHTLVYGICLLYTSVLLPVTKQERHETDLPYRYDLNYCTFSYSMAFWDWERWEKEID